MLSQHPPPLWWVLADALAERAAAAAGRQKRLSEDFGHVADVIGHVAEVVSQHFSPSGGCVVVSVVAAVGEQAVRGLAIFVCRWSLVMHR